MRNVQDRFIRSMGDGQLWLGILSTFALFAGFFANAWRVADPGWFDRHQRDTEGMVVLRLAQSREHGIFSKAGLNGWIPKTDDQISYYEHALNHYRVYLSGDSVKAYQPYMSQHGGQSMMFGALAQLVPLGPNEKLTLFRAVTSLLSALALSAVTVWFAMEFGVWVGVCVAASMVVSQWLTVFGRNLWWSLWAFYVPMLATMWFLKSHFGKSRRVVVALALVVFGSVLLKCFINGYEYLTTTIVMLLVPVAYYSLRDRWGITRTLKLTTSAVLASGTAVLTSLVGLCFQIGVLKGGFEEGVEHVLFSLGKRTHGSPENFPEKYASSLEADIPGVVTTYLQGTFFDLENYVRSTEPLVELLVFAVTYWQLIVVFAAASVFVVVRRWVRSDSGRPGFAPLLGATWFALLGPLSWFVIFKAHSYVHTHMNYLVWQMPFTFFGFALCAVAVREALAPLLSGPRCG